MLTRTPEEQLSDRLSESLNSLDIDSEDWGKSRLLFGGDDSDMRHSDELVFFRNQIQTSLNIEPLKSEHLAKFLVTCLGRRVLQLPSIRELLLQFEIVTYPERKSRLMQCLKISTQDEQDLIDAVRNMNWRMGANLPKRFLHEIRLPIGLANSMAGDPRPPMEMIHPYRLPKPLLPFQNTVKNEIISTFNQEERCLVVMPTGSGKTRTAIQSIGEFLNQTSSDYNGILWIADRDELCEQAAETFASLLPFMVGEMVPLWRYWDGRGVEISHDGSDLMIEGIVITSHQQMSKRLTDKDPIAQAIISSSKIVIFDEAHRWLAWNVKLSKQIEKSNPRTKIVGLTATPFRRDSKENSELFEMYSRNVITPYKESLRDPNYTLKRLTEERILAKRIDLQPDDIGCSIVADSTPMVRMNEGLEIIEKFVERGSQSVIVFTESVDQAKQMSICLSMKGIESAHLDSNTPPGSRRRIIERFRTGEITVLLNYMILTTGFDAPAIDTVVILRKRNSEDLPVIQQMIGRGLRGSHFGGTEECTVFIRGML